MCADLLSYYISLNDGCMAFWLFTQLHRHTNQWTTLRCLAFTNGLVAVTRCWIGHVDMASHHHHNHVFFFSLYRVGVMLLCQTSRSASLVVFVMAIACT